MLTTRIIPCLDVKDGRVVKGVRFVGLRDAGDPVETARRYDVEGADEKLKQFKTRYKKTEVFPVSADKGDGLDPLKERLGELILGEVPARKM